MICMCSCRLRRIKLATRKNCFLNQETLYVHLYASGNIILLKKSKLLLLSSEKIAIFFLQNNLLIHSLY